jgi:DNA-binding transcriptional LysR family regulator
MRIRMEKNRRLTDAFDVAAIDWALIRSFAAVVRTGNLTRAAKLLKTTQPTVGRHIRKLEELTGEVLFDRIPGGFRPTERATELFEKAETLDDAVVAFSRSLRGESPGLAGPVRITTSHMFGVEVMPTILCDLLHHHPRLEIELSVRDDVANLLRREADIAVRFFRPTQDDLIAVQIGSTAMGLFASRAYFERTGLAVPQTPQQVKGHLIIGEEHALRAISFGVEHSVAIGRGDVRFRSASMPCQLAAVRAGLGIGPAPIRVGERDQSLVRVFPEIAVAAFPVWIVAHDDLNRSPRMRAVFDHLVAALRTFVD